MSNSRLEKFIYAICGMEVDDLPTPLSRIETLWNCLITGETPDFEPLSRNEKYLMSMLTGDVDALPEPTSRSEKLLYKIATGETDLTDVPGYLSRYEELLKYLIENGGIGGTDFEYVLYTLNKPLNTLYCTAEAPVRSAILSGQTLNSVIPLDFSGGRLDGEIVDGTWIKLTANGTPRYTFFPISKAPTLKPSTDYILFMEVRRNTISGGTNSSQYTVFGSSGAIRNMDGTGNTVEFKTQTIRCRTSEDISSKSWSFDGYLHNSQTSGEVEFRMMFLEYQDGMENWDIPYFEGMQSVKMPVLTTTGKNLLDPKNMELVVSDRNHANLFTYDETNDSYEFLCSDSFNQMNIKFKNLYGITSESQIYVSGTYDSDGSVHEVTRRIIVNTDVISIQIIHDWKPVTKANLKIMITSDTNNTTTTHEPYKTNILSCNEEVTLRGIGEVKDTLDGNTGELTQRIGEVVLDGSENWVAEDIRFRLSRNDIIPNKWSNGISNYFIGNRGQLMSGADYDNYFAINGYGLCLYVRDINLFPNPKSQLNEFKSWLSERNAQGNPVILQYCLSQEVIKTVDLSILDQDGQPTKLKTFNDITHVSIEAEDLLPTVDLEVATKIEETLSSLPIQMIDISEKQHSLNEKIDEQAENINEVSTAMIEIRNDIL